MEVYGVIGAHRDASAARYARALIFPYTIEGLRQHKYQSGDIQIRSTLDKNDSFTTYLIDYPSDGLNISGVMQIPAGAGPFPVIVLNHGFFSRSAYQSGDGTDRAAAFLAKHGYITLASDYRSWGDSDIGNSFFYSGLAIDVINLLNAIPSLREADPNRIGMWGHSMGGQVTLRAMVVSKEIKAGVIWPFCKSPAIFKCPADKSTAINAQGQRVPRVRSMSMSNWVGGNGESPGTGFRGGWGNGGKWHVYRKIGQMSKPGPEHERLKAYVGAAVPRAGDIAHLESPRFFPGGGGGVSYVILGGFALLEQYGLVPRLLAGTSMGAVLLLFRARRLRWQPEDIAEAMRGLSFKTLFRFLHGESRYGLPAAMRLYLRAAIGDFLKGPDGHPLTLGQLAIPLVVAVTGIRNGALPRDPSYYEHLLDLHGREPRPSALSRMMSEIFQALGELVVQRDRLARIYLGADEETRAFDAIDAVGFSSALPGVIHYDVVRDDERMHALLRALLDRHDVFRLVDGGLVDNLPARAAWGAVQRGAIGTRNVFVLALEGFGPKLSQPLWFGLEQLAAQNVARSRPFVHHHRSFQRVLSPLEVVPGEAELQRAVQAGKAELNPDMPLVARLCRPFPPLEP